MKRGTYRDRLIRLGTAMTSELVKRPATVQHYVTRSSIAILDDHFHNTSPIPFLENDLLNGVYRHEVVLPAKFWMGAGNQSLEGLAFLAGLVKQLGAGQAFEIGTYNGVTSWCLARNVSNLQVDTLDLPPAEETLLPLETGDLNHRVDFPTRQYPLAKESGSVHQHWGDSASFDFTPWQDRCDLVYIDGAHSAPYVKSDTQNALMMINRCGAIVWDDYWRQIAGVPEVLDALYAGELEGRLRRIPSTRLVMYVSEALELRLLSAT